MYAILDKINKVQLDKEMITMKVYVFVCLLLLPFQGFADIYYAKFNNKGQTSEAGVDIVLYYDNGNVWGYLRDYSNIRDNIYVDLYGQGNPKDMHLLLKGVSYSEGEMYQAGETSVVFEGKERQTIKVNGVSLSKHENVIEGMQWLGAKKTQQEIVAGVDKFISKKSKEIVLAQTLVDQLPKPNIGNTRQVNLTPLNFNALNNQLDKVFNALSQQPDARLLKRFTSDPAFAIAYGFQQIGVFPEIKQFSAYEDDGKVGYTLKTCDANVNIEDDEDGLCQTFHVYHPRNLDVSTVLLEVEAHRTCLDDSCQHDYYRLELRQGNRIGWRVNSQSKGMRCETYRGGGSPPCL